MTNIIYLTSRCNLSCPYCYEKNKKKIIDISKEEIDEFMKYIIKNENNKIISVICVMGGEPFLRFDMLQYLFSSCKKIFKKTGKLFSINVITNGTYIYKYISYIEEMIKDNDMPLYLDISYDGSAQEIRTPNSNLVKDCIKLLRNLKLPIGISYTISKYNYDIDIITKDIITILEEFYTKNYGFQERIRINIDKKSVENKIDMEKLKKRLEYIYTLYNIPICEQICNLCNICQRDEDDLIYYIPKSGIQRNKRNKISPFIHF